MKRTNSPSPFGLSRAIPPKHLKAILFIAALVIALPLLAFAAKMTTNLTPRAFLPSAQPLCKQALLQFSLKDPCVLKDPNATPTSTQTKTYRSITFTCFDGFIGSSNSSDMSCKQQQDLMSYAYTTCTAHSYIKSLEYTKTCRPASDSTDQTSAYAQSTKYICADGTSGTYSVGCQSRDAIISGVNELCKKHSLCPAPTATATPTKKITPIPPVTITDSPRGNTLPRITTASLPNGDTNSPYGASIDATDKDKDPLTMSISGLPFGLSYGPCASLVTGGSITCSISGTPERTGIYTVKVNVTDGRGGSTDKTLLLSVYESRSNPNPAPSIPPSAN